MQSKNTDSMLFKQQGNDCYSKKQYQQAVKHYDKALELNPDFKEAWLNKGLCLRQMKGKQDEAIAAFSAAIECDPLYAKAVYNLAEMLKGKRPQEALAVIDTYTGKGGDDSEVLKLRKKIEFDKGINSFVKTASPDAAAGALEEMKKSVEDINDLIKTVTQTSLKTLENLNDPNDEKLQLLGRQFENLGNQLENTVKEKQEELTSILNQTGDAPKLKCYWAGLIYNKKFTVEHIANNLAKIPPAKYPKTGINCFSSEEEANGALKKFFAGEKKMLVSGYVFTSNVSSAQLESLFKPEKREKPDSEVLRSTIESWKEYNYNRREDKLVLTEPQEKIRQSSEFVNLSLNVG